MGGESKAYLLQRLSVVVQRWNAASGLRSVVGQLGLDFLLLLMLYSLNLLLFIFIYLFNYFTISYNFYNIVLYCIVLLCIEMH